jgi:hypothetical protein
MPAAFPAARSCGSAPAGHQLILHQDLFALCMSATVTFIAGMACLTSYADAKQ